uniref:Phosphatidylinositol-glycan biosynthesis class S protein, putative n=1 Tax=Theileria annulata TaxID=5874 RepID=A0A3B0MMS3_THEAN
MKSQRLFILYYFSLIFGIFYLKYFHLLKNETNLLNLHRLKLFLNLNPKFFKYEYILYYDPNNLLTKKISVKLSNFLSSKGLSSSLSNLEASGLDLLSDDIPDDESEDSTALDKKFAIVVNYENADKKSKFNLRVKGGNTLIFTINSTTIYSEDLVQRIFSLIYKLFFDTSGLKIKEYKPFLDLNFVLLSDKGRVSWDFTKDVLSPYLNVILSSISLFYEVNLHSRVVSNVDYYKKMVLNSDNEESEEPNEEAIFELGNQETNFYNFFEGISNIDISMKDQHSFRHSLNFFVILSSKPTFLKDPFTGQKRDSFTIDNLGVFTFLNNRIKSDEYKLTEEDISELVSTWVTYIRHMHSLPASLSEYALWLCNLDENLMMVSDNEYFISKGPDSNNISMSDSFELTFDAPANVSFYRFELLKLSKIFYHSYIKGTLINLKKLSQVKRVYFNNQVPKSTAEFVKNTFYALEHSMGHLFMQSENSLDTSFPTLVSMDMNQKALSLARFAYSQSLEALSDDQMFPKNILSHEHNLAVFMCDVFPFVFPVLAFYLRMGLQNLKSR